MKTILLILTLCFSLPLSAERLKVGLVLGGGGAKGAAEIGVLKAIKKAGIPIDYVAGTSIGSLIGGLYCAGVSPEKMEELFMRQDWISLFTDRNQALRNEVFTEKDGKYYVYGFPVWSKKNNWRDGVLPGDSITSLLSQLTGQTKEMSFDDLQIPFRCVVVDLETMKEHVLDKGVLSECLRTSMSIPLAFTTQMRNGKKYIDGGAINNFPVDVVKEMGADVVIAVDLDGRSEAEIQANANSGIDWLDWLVENVNVGSLVNMIVGENEILESEQVNLGSIINWLLTKPDDKKYAANKKMVDICITPYLGNYTIASFTPTKVKEMIQIGEQAGNKAMPQLLELWKRIYLESFGLE